MMVYGRENAGQLFEITVSYICIKMLQFIQMNVLDAGECIGMYLDLLRIVSPSMETYMEMSMEMSMEESMEKCLVKCMEKYMVNEIHSIDIEINKF